MIQAQDYELHEVIEAAYWAGFEPSEDNLTSAALFSEAEQFLSSYLFTH